MGPVYHKSSESCGCFRIVCNFSNINSLMESWNWLYFEFLNYGDDPKGVEI